MSKFNNRKTIVDGIEFDSIKESERYLDLKLLERAKEISQLELQPEFLLQGKFRYEGKAIREIKYIADFKYYDNREQKMVVEDVKGVRTKEYMIKKKLFLKQYGAKYSFREI